MQAQNSIDDQMVGVLLAGGTGSRMAPLTAHTNKHLIPVYMRPMVEYALGTLLNMGLRNILVITGRHHMGRLVEVLGSGMDYGEGVQFTFKVQERAFGIAHALGLAERFAMGRRVAVMLADNLIDDDRVFEVAQSFAKADPSYAVNFLTEVDDPRAYGVATVKNGQIEKIVEKPRQPESNLAVTGLYLYPADVFDKVRRLTPSARNELEITDINNMYVGESRLRYHEVDRWFDAGEPSPWMRTQRYVQEHPDRFKKARFRLREK